MRLGLVICLSVLLAQLGCAETRKSSLPDWLLQLVAAEKKKTKPGTFEESRYNGNRAFHFIRGDIADRGDEHVLFAEDGKEICRFGGIVGHVTSGKCDLGKIVHIRTLY